MKKMTTSKVKITKKKKKRLRTKMTNIKKTHTLRVLFTMN